MTITSREAPPQDVLFLLGQIDGKLDGLVADSTRTGLRLDTVEERQASLEKDMVRVKVVGLALGALAFAKDHIQPLLALLGH